MSGSRALMMASAVVLLLFMGTIVAADAGTHATPTAGVPATSSAAPSAAVTSPAAAVHAGHPVSPGTRLNAAPPQSAAVPMVNTTPPWSCSPYDTAVVFPGVGVNFTVATTPANGSGAAPVNFTWNITVGGGGLPPFHPWVYLSTASEAVSSFNFTGNATLGQAGIWQVSVLVEDSTCTQASGTDFDVMAWNAALGPHPVVVTVTPSNATAPANVTYTFTAPTVPVNWSLYWMGVGFYPYLPVENHTYYLAGTYNETACLVEPDGTDYDCDTSPNVVVSGPSPLQTAVTVAPGPYPVNVTFWANITNASAFPAGTSIYLYAWNGTSGNSVSTTNHSANLTESVGCGFPWTKWAVPSGVCVERASVVLTAPVGAPDDSNLAYTEIWANLTANGSPVNWWPSVSYTYGPSNGTAPLNVSVNVSASNGLAPYTLIWTVAGDSGNGTGSVLFNVTSSVLYPWNGTLTTLTISLPLVGYYWIVLEVLASNDGFANFALPLVVVGNATIPPFLALKVAASESSPNGTSPGNASIGEPLQFVATPTGGDGPYTVQWNFGDGQFASSVPGVTIQHSYTSAGQFVPTVVVTDARGTQVTTTLPTVTVLAGSSNGSGPGGSGSGHNGSGTGGTHSGQILGPSASAAPTWVFPATVAVAAAFMLAGLVLSGREVGREGEALVAGLEPDDPSNLPRRLP